ncbi:hypothetical protein E4665_02980 [Sporolactobacillus shoreae]|uniref:Uncharacterized protein n=1 Tax=Sporolactobacillus shoreae TaxID=1465501 RepID=A0A4Z0GSN8_9BACL|nr:hypothetical protein [Sporolactobacillus shoreae]TGA99926.1 hypothetical protein E4665_02980 [Sporolactobacillus shoreae]
MKTDQLTCRQRVTFIFNFYPHSERSGSVVTLKNWQNRLRTPDSGTVRELSNYLSIRLEHIARMIEILQSENDQWIVTGKRDRIILETDNIDFHSAVDALAEEGFRAQDYQLDVEYERKWGIL